MTTVAAFLDDRGDVAIAGDQRLTYSYSYPTTSKLRRVGDAVVGWSGSSIASRFVEQLVGPVNPVEVGDAFVRWLRERGCGTIDSRDGVWVFDASLLIVRPGERPWLIPAEGSAVQAATGYCAIGSGGAVAIGALHVARRQCVSAAEAMAWALDAANAHDGSTSGCEIIRLDRPVAASHNEFAAG